ncbi:hypothetical protein [Mycobacterium leprae]|uniref:hypothetical protein n=1 Tax=Mycobacterium leprae TaxID=1769 RepID=UPI000674C631|nr:hypothetical protein [Mycobacterium leprae]OAR20517.1 hypothetical protein A8144_02580 [Mycobacterium leprae 3125609]OAX70370.1 hypothetical protein A3216_12405 [Mycobacterium leprae 7935681]
MYLPPDTQDRLFYNITALSAPGSQLATEYHPDSGATMSQSAQDFRQAVGQIGLRHRPVRTVLRRQAQQCHSLPGLLRLAGDDQATA